MAVSRKYDYLVNRDTDPITLIRLGDTSAEVFTANGEWIDSPRLNEIRYGKGPFMEFDDISESEAMAIIKSEMARYRKEGGK